MVLNPFSSKPPAFSFIIALISTYIYRDIGQSKPGQRVVKPGAIILGYPRDSVVDNKNLPVRPPFTKDGSFMVFRKLEQNVLVLEDYVAKYWQTMIPSDVAGKNSITLTTNQRKQLFAARLVGRFKSASYAIANSPVWPMSITSMERKTARSASNANWRTQQHKTYEEGEWKIKCGLSFRVFVPFPTFHFFSLFRIPCIFFWLFLSSSF